MRERNGGGGKKRFAFKMSISSTSWWQWSVQQSRKEKLNVAAFVSLFSTVIFWQLFWFLLVCSNSWNFLSFAKFIGIFFVLVWPLSSVPIWIKGEIKTTLLCTSGQNTQFQRAYFSSLRGLCWLKVSLFLLVGLFFSPFLLWSSHYFIITELPSNLTEMQSEALPAEYRCLLKAILCCIQIPNNQFQLCLLFFCWVLWIFVMTV